MSLMLLELTVGVIVLTALGYLCIGEEWFGKVVLALILSIGIITGISGVFVANGGNLFVAARPMSQNGIIRQMTNGGNLFVAALFVFLSVLSLAIVFFGQRYRADEKNS